MTKLSAYEMLKNSSKCELRGPGGWWVFTEQIWAFNFFFITKFVLRKVRGSTRIEEERTRG